MEYLSPKSHPLPTPLSVTTAIMQSERFTELIGFLNFASNGRVCWLCLYYIKIKNIILRNKLILILFEFSSFLKRFLATGETSKMSKLSNVIVRQPWLKDVKRSLQKNLIIKIILFTSVLYLLHSPFYISTGALNIQVFSYRLYGIGNR